MAVQIGAKLDSGFDDPIGMLRDCHRRIERFLGILCQLAERGPSGTLTGEESNAVLAALQYFRVGGQRHTADEEESLFPRLRGAIHEGSSEAIDRLENDHREANDLHEAVDRLYSEWISTGTLSPEDRQSLSLKTSLLRHLYAEHIQTEETAVFPQASQLLDRDAIAAIGVEFRARRK
jgi:hemerythrin-like domain-containing protein